MAAVSAALPYGESQLVIHVVGARPNFIKMAPLIEALRQRGVNRQLVVHTGQHYDRRMSEEILDRSRLPDARSLARRRLGPARRADRRRC